MRSTASLHVFAAVALAASAALAIADRPVSADGLDSGYATDAYPGFDLKQSREPEFKEKSFWLSVKRDSPAAQLEFARAFETNGNFKAAAKAYEALVREWPASAVAAEAQRRKAAVLTRMAADKSDMSLYSDAFDEYEYLMHYFPGLCNYGKVAELQYKIACHLLDEKKSMLGIKYDTNREKRLRFESVVRRAPGASWVPDAMLTIGDLRVDDDELSEADWEARRDKAFELMYARARELQGQVSGEHGIGLVKRPYLKESLPEASLVLMRGIKKVFDPNNILNPHKVCQA